MTYNQNFSLFYKCHVRKFFFGLLVFISLSKCHNLSSRSINSNNNNKIVQSRNNNTNIDGLKTISTKNICPLCGIDSSNPRKEKPLHKITECEKINNTFLVSNNKYMPSYKCKCKYLKVNEKSCTLFSRNYNDPHQRFENLFISMKASDFMNEDELIDEQNDNDESPVYNAVDNQAGEVSKKASHSTNECLIVHVGMAVKGYNLMYKQWVNKENCFNLCINTTIKNGFSFDCKSFEHWHSDCATPTGDPTFGGSNRTKSAVCATFTSSQDKRRHFIKNDLEDESTGKFHKKRASNKIDYCVLSNQTIQTAGKNFAENIAVTYYELLCKREDVSSITNSNKNASSNITKSSDKVSSDTATVKQTTTKKFSTKIVVWNVSSSSKTMKSSYKQTNNKKKESNDSSVEIIYDFSSSSKPIKKNKVNNTHKLIENDDLVFKPSKKCEFNPCQNDGSCYLIETQRFTCFCKELYYGVYCEHSVIHKRCHKKHMELIIHNDIAKKLKTNIDGLYMNKKINPSSCKLRRLNETHGMFHISYEKCATIETTSKFEKIYINKLYSSLSEDIPDIDDSSSKYLTSFECRIDKAEFENQKLGKHTNKPNSEINVNSSLSVTKAPCIIDLLNIKIRLYQDEENLNEIITESDSLQSSKPVIEHENKIFVQLTVEYSQKLDQLYQIKDKLQYFHLTIERCWLSRTQNENSNIVQLLIENGCPKENVKFYDTSLTKNAIRFSFSLLNSREKSTKLNQFYLHCFPEICTDAPKIIKDDKFYYQYKMCHNISYDCESESNKNTKSKNDHGQTIIITENNEKKYELSNNDNNELQNSNENDVYAIKSIINRPNNCNNKFTKGPIFIQYLSNRLDRAGDVASSKNQSLKNNGCASFKFLSKIVLLKINFILLILGTFIVLSI